MSENITKIPQQSLNLLRQCLGAIGWAKTVGDFYLAGRLLSERLPTVDLSWIKTPAEVAEMSPEARALYNKSDATFADMHVELPYFENQELDVIKRCIEATFSKIPADKYSFILLKTFNIK